MKRNITQFFVILQFTILFTSCDLSGKLFLINGYEYNVKAHTLYDYNGTIVEQFIEFLPELTYLVAAGSSKYDNITAIQLETLDGIVLANYTSEYLILLRRVYMKKKKNYREEWVFTEKGLFLITDEIRKYYKFDNEKILAYYRSDEAVKDLQELLKTE